MWDTNWDEGAGKGVKEVPKMEPVASAKPLNYAPPPPPRKADPRRMFLYVLPTAISFAAGAGSVMIEVAFPKGDSRNFAGPLVFLLAAPLGLVFGVFAIREAFRPGRLRALLWGIAWNAVVAICPCIAIWALIKFGLLKHV
jgi:hypothetical protein